VAVSPSFSFSASTSSSSPSAQLGQMVRVHRGTSMCSTQCTSQLPVLWASLKGVWGKVVSAVVI
jgi:hypothetical protein